LRFLVILLLLLHNLQNKSFFIFYMRLLAVGCWQLAAGGWQLAAGGWFLNNGYYFLNKAKSQ